MNSMPALHYLRTLAHGAIQIVHPDSAKYYIPTDYDLVMDCEGIQYRILKHPSNQYIVAAPIGSYWEKG